MFFSNVIGLIDYDQLAYEYNRMILKHVVSVNLIQTSCCGFFPEVSRHLCYIHNFGTFMLLSVLTAH